MIIDFDYQENMSNKAKSRFTERRTDNFDGSTALINQVGMKECRRCCGRTRRRRRRTDRTVN